MFKSLTIQAVAEFDLVAKGPVLIGDKAGNKIDPTQPDITFLSGQISSDGHFSCVIPGSSIKGAIRSYCEQLLDGEIGAKTQSLFGKVANKNNKDSQKSKIYFHDAFAVPETLVISTRFSTAIDPFTQSPKSTSLNNVGTVDKGVFKAGFRIVNFSNEEIKAILDALSKINTGEILFGGRKSRGFGYMNVENFRLTVNNGYNEDFEPVNEKTLDSLEKAFSYFDKEIYNER